MAPGRDSQALLLTLHSLLYQKGSRTQVVTVGQSEFSIIVGAFPKETYSLIMPHQLRHAAC